MNYVKMSILCGLVALSFIGCGGSDDSGSEMTSVSSYVHEREFVKDSNFFAQPDQVVVLNLETPNDYVSDDEDTGGIGDDLIRSRLKKAAEHEFKLNIPDGDLFTMTVTGPAGYVVALLNKDNPSATVGVNEGIHTFSITHGGGTVRSRALFMRPGSTIVGKDCPDCNLSGINLKFHNLSEADMTGADLSNADLSNANLEYADLTGTKRDGTNLNGAVLTGTKGFYPAPATGCTSGPDCYTVYPAAWKWSSDGLSGTDYAQVTFVQCDKNGTNCSNNSTRIGHTGDTPVGISLKDGKHWKVTVENNHEPVPFITLIKSSNTEGWSLASPCNGSDIPEKAYSQCGGNNLIESVEAGKKDIRSLFPPADNSRVQNDRTYLLDMNKKTGNYLFRGAEPCIQKAGSTGPWTFDYEGLVAGMQQRVQKQLGKTKNLPKKFILIDVSLINDGSENAMLKAEYEFFGGSGSNITANAFQPALNEDAHTINSDVTGRLLWWDIMPLVDGAKSSNLTGLVDELSLLMNTDNTGKNATPYVIYIHCASGQDRTGEVAISYLLKNSNMSSADAFVYGTTIYQPANAGVQKTRFPPHDDYLVGAAWYNLMLCNENSSHCETLLAPYSSPGPLDSCTSYKAICTDCSDIKSCYDFSDTVSTPGSSAYPNEYPWSTSTSHKWAEGCSK